MRMGDGQDWDLDRTDMWEVGDATVSQSEQVSRALLGEDGGDDAVWPVPR
jgi:hypothetical protein